MRYFFKKDLTNVIHLLYNEIGKRERGEKNKMTNSERRKEGFEMRRLKASDFPKDIWEYGAIKVKRCLRKMREYAKVDFNIPEEELEEVVNEAMSLCTDITDDEIIWESLNLIIIK